VRWLRTCLSFISAAASRSLGKVADDAAVGFSRRKMNGTATHVARPATVLPSSASCRSCDLLGFIARGRLTCPRERVAAARHVSRGREPGSPGCGREPASFQPIGAGMVEHAQPRRETLGLALPVADHRHRADQERSGGRGAWAVPVAIEPGKRTWQPFGGLPSTSARTVAVL
jgi:hypothetical protein